MINLIRVVEILHETKDEEDCGELVPICLLDGNTLTMGYEVYVPIMENTLRYVTYIDEKTITLSQCMYENIKDVCTHQIDIMKDSVAEAYKGG